MGNKIGLHVFVLMTEVMRIIMPNLMVIHWGKMKVGLNNNLSSMNAFWQTKGGNSIPSGLEAGIKDNILKDKPQNGSPSFTGINHNKVTKFISEIPNAVQKGYDRLFLERVAVTQDLNKIIRETDRAVGKNFLAGRLEEFEKLYGTRASNFIQRNKDKNHEFLIVRDRTFAGKIIHGLAETAKFPLDAICALSKVLNRIPGLRDFKPVSDLANSKLVTKRRNEKAGEELFYRLKGILSYDDMSKLQEDIFKVPEGKPVGNYAPKSERALNRIITGLVSSWFVGKDFYNLTMYNTNDKEQANEAGKRRFNREVSRIGLNAFLTYAVLGAFSGFASRSKAVACGLIAGTSLVSEILTRVCYGTPLRPLSPEGAKKYNLKRAAKKNKPSKTPALGKPWKNPQQSAPASTPTPTPIYLTSTAPKVFDPFTKMRASYGQSFGQAGFAGYQQPAPSLQNQTFEAQRTVQIPKRKEVGNKIKKLINAKNIGFTILAFNLIYGAARSKSSSFDDFCKALNKAGGDLYNSVAKSRKKLVVSQDELKKFLDAFNGQGFDKIKNKYSYLIQNLKFTPAQREILMQGVTDGKISINPADLNNEKTKIFLDVLNDTVLSKLDAQLAARAKKDPNFHITTERYEVINDLKELFMRHGVKNGKPVAGVDVSGYSHDASNDKFDKIISNLNVESINFKLNQTSQGFVMSEAEYDFGRILYRPFLKGVADAAAALKGAVSQILFLPINTIDMLVGKTERELDQDRIKAAIESSRKIYPNLGELYNDCSTMYQKLKHKRISKQEFSDYLASANTKFLNKDTTPRYPQTALASVSRNLVTVISSYFFINDFRNEVLIQSNGENTEKAKEVSKEKLMHKACNFVFNKCFMEFFNHAFEPWYLGSLSGATIVAGMTEFTNESAIRGSIGIPLRKMPNKESIDEHEKKHMEAKGFKGWYFRTIAKVTGKKRLSEKAESDKK